LGGERLAAHGPFVFALENLKGLVFAVMDVRWRTAAGHIVRFDRAEYATGVTAVDANQHRDAQDVHLLSTVVRDLDRLQVSHNVAFFAGIFIRVHFRRNHGMGPNVRSPGVFEGRVWRVAQTSESAVSPTSQSAKRS